MAVSASSDGEAGDDPLVDPLVDPEADPLLAPGADSATTGNGVRAEIAQGQPTMLPTSALPTLTRTE